MFLVAMSPCSTVPFLKIWLVFSLSLDILCCWLSISSEYVRVYRAPESRRDMESLAESGSFRCLPQTIKMISCKQSRSGTAFSPNSDVRYSSSQQECSTGSSPLGSSRSASNRMTDPLGKPSSSRGESFHEEKDKMIKIEERLVASHYSYSLAQLPICF